MKRLLLSLIFLILFSGCSHNQEFNPLLARNISYKIYLDGKYLCLYNNKDQSFEIFDMSKGLEAVK